MSATTAARRPSGVDARKRKKWGKGEVQRHGAFLSMLLPGFAFLVVFSYMPMVGVILAFKRYALVMPPKGHWLSNPFLYDMFIANKFVGLQNFEFMFKTPMAATIFRNTIGYSLLFMAVGLIFAVGLAIMITELRQGRMAKVYHTLIFLPYFISWIVVAYIVYALFSQQTGLLNAALRRMGRNPVVWYNEARYWPFVFLFANLWRYTGNGSIIYMATISGFDQQLYEAAAIDGASKWQQLWRITIPQLIPTIVLLQILAVGRIFTSDFDMFYSLPNGSGPLKNVSTTIDVYVYNTMKSATQLGLPAAAAFFQSTVSLVLILSTNLIVRRLQPEMALF